MSTIYQRQQAALKRDAALAKGRGGDLQTMDRAERAAVQKTRTASPSAKAAPGGPRVPPKPPVVVAASPAPGGGSLLVRGVSDGLLARLEVARSKRGLRSRNDAVLAILDEGAPK